MSPFITMLLILTSVKKVITRVIITVDMNKVPENAGILDTDHPETQEYFLSFLPEEINVSEIESVSLEQIDLVLTPHLVAETVVEHNHEVTAEVKIVSGSNSEATEAPSDQAVYFEEQANTYKAAIEKTKQYAKGCIKSKGVCKPERVIEDLTV